MSTQIRRLRLLLGLGIAAWTLTLASAGVWQLGHLRATTVDLAEAEAKANFDKDLAFRRWATSHGGVYVPATDKTPPNPYLNVPERDIVTPSGKKLTLINPAYMLRQLHEQYGELVGVRSHITSNKPLRPENGPDAWERAALESFERGATEAIETTEIDGAPHLRYMQPLVAQRGCLKCHAHQGYKEGDIRGGVSVAVPLAPFEAREAASRRGVIVSLAAIWILGLVGFAIGYRRLAGDIRAQAAAAEEIRRLNADLEARVEARTEELSAANRALAVSRDAADTANRAKSMFLASMSHELRTPLNAILGFSQIMTRDATAAQRENLAIIERSGEHLLSLVNDVLDLAKIESGRMTLEQSVVDLPRALTDLGEMMRLRAEAKNLGFALEIATDLPRYVLVDAKRLRQVLINLIGNAVKYTDEGGVGVRVRAAKRDGRPWLEVEVEDTGHGIAREDLDRIFEPFVQLPGGGSNVEGTGLGLPITREFAELMGGALRVSSELGQGSLFTFEVPIVEAAASEVRASAEPRRVTALAPGQPAYRILVVDDVADNRLLLRKLLEGAGFAVREASDGFGAVALAAAWRPDLVWMDMRMPGMDGYEATKRIKADPASSGAIVVALTASAFTDERANVLAAGCVDMLRKPFRASELFDVMARRLGARYVYEEAAPQAPSSTLDAAGTANLVVEALAALPSDLTSALERSLVEGDVEAVSASIEGVAGHNLALADHLRAQAQGFRFGEMIDWLAKAAVRPASAHGAPSVADRSEDSRVF